jgi:hypothetical protein
MCARRCTKGIRNFQTFTVKIITSKLVMQSFQTLQEKLKDMYNIEKC